MKNKSGFEKFYKDKKSGGAKKEAFRKEKREVRKERSEQIEAKKARFKASPARPGGGPARDWQSDIKNIKAEIRDKNGTADRKPQFIKKAAPGGGRREDARNKSSFRAAKPEKGREDRKDFGPGSRSGTFKDGDNKTGNRRPQPAEGRRPAAKDDRRDFRNERPVTGKEGSKTPILKKASSSVQLKKRDENPDSKPSRSPLPAHKKDKPAGQRINQPRERAEAGGKPGKPTAKPIPQNVKPAAVTPQPQEAAQMPLNKYISHGGICSRRDAAALIRGGKVKVNGELILEPGHKVWITDDVRAAGKKVTPVKEFVYILLNKPKDFITTTDDPQGRRTVLDLIRHATSERVYPIGRLDRNTSGVLLLTNDGELSQKLTHPSNEITKIYSVTLDKPLQKADFEAILKGVPLEDGLATVDVLAYSDSKDKTQVGVELHTGRNRIVRRIFEHLGYEVKNLDRVVFAGLTKKNVERGKWRHLAEKEVRQLKYFGKGK